MVNVCADQVDQSVDMLVGSRRRNRTRKRLPKSISAHGQLSVIRSSQSLCLLAYGADALEESSLGQPSKDLENAHD
jgi:hypothetical protein